jgi:hypothetical protein
MTTMYNAYDRSNEVHANQFLKLCLHDLLTDVTTTACKDESVRTG